jgi:hypothetical protein
MQSLPPVDALKSAVLTIIEINGSDVEVAKNRIEELLFVLPSPEIRLSLVLREFDLGEG